MYKLLDTTHPQWNDLLHLLIDEALPHFAKQLEAKGMQVDRVAMERAGWQSVYRCQDGGLLFAVVGGCAILGFTVHHAWWAKHPILNEEFIYRCDDGEFKDILAGIESLAQDFGCHGVTIGGLALEGKRSEAYDRLLKQVGFREIARAHYKETY